ncbi:alanine acetyltransferase [Blastococcus sp. TF02-8]|uniref:GNAT family N-acetyltransferase n=1 Tax=Blastococcus sp. TF02-8 TaxID=2250574 RepID=UPI000DEB79A5|nr:GNAT family protein [Blastococcus sp. TF02-8]RBY97149.1 alanine acetyltransferase [Blastococcus sp. TF02-8]
MLPPRLVTLDDAPALAALLRENRGFLAPYEPHREESFYTEAGQRTRIADGLAGHTAGTGVPLVVLGPDGEVAGQITLSGLVRGPLQSAVVGYWVAQRYTRQGLAAAALAHVVRLAFDELGLHRLEAGTLVDNVASQAVLARNGFQRYGLAPRYLHVGGRWQDHVLFQVLNEAMEEPTAVSTGPG